MGLRFKFNSKTKVSGPRIKLVLVTGPGPEDQETLTEFESPVPAATLLSDLEVRCDETDTGMNLVIDATLAALPQEEEAPPPAPKKRAGRPPGSKNKPRAEKIAEVKEKIAEAKGEAKPVEKATAKAKETPAYSEETKTESKKSEERRSAAATVAAKVVEEARAKAKKGDRETFVDGDGRTIDAATGEVLAELDKTLSGKTETKASAAASSDPF